jgi:hypothetical protein
MAKFVRFYHFSPDTYWDMDCDDREALRVEMEKAIEQANKARG